MVFPPEEEEEKEEEEEEEEDGHVDCSRFREQLSIVIQIVNKQTNNMFTNKQTNNDCGWIQLKFY